LERSVTLRGWSWPRAASLLLGAGMAGVAALTLRHFYTARFPTSIQDAAACDASAFFNCANSALAPVAAIHGVPLGFFGLMVGALVVVGALLPSGRLERANALLAVVAAILATGLTLYSVLGLRSLCTTCTAYTVLALASAALFLGMGGFGPAGGRVRALAGGAGPLLVFAGATLLGAYGVSLYTRARIDARSGDAAARVVHQYFALDSVPGPSVLSPYWTIRSSARFEDAPIHIIEYGDLLCPDCQFFAEQMHRLAREFPGQINVAYQFFPLEARCNDVVTKDIHPAACDMAYMAAYRPALFSRIHDDIFAHLDAAKHDPAWRAGLARRYGVEAALTDTATRALVRRLIETGAEYEKTSAQYAHGIRSTPTLILNGRMVIGTLPDEQMRAIFQALVDRRLGRGKRFMENWVE
jgi:uncharacterized membrane protein/protein-disulfide isomerase